MTTSRPKGLNLAPSRRNCRRLAPPPRCPKQTISLSRRTTTADRNSRKKQIQPPLLPVEKYLLYANRPGTADSPYAPLTRPPESSGMDEGEESPYIVEDRRMLSRASGDRVRITHTIEPGRRTPGCLTCCYAPESCSPLRCLPCFAPPEDVVNQMSSSRYIYVRENSLEWNNPSMQPARGRCCGRTCCRLSVVDDVTVLYFDDMNFDGVRNGTRRCNDCLTFCCGGGGEQVRMESDFCFGGCVRGRGNVICVPVCCPEPCCPCLVKNELWVEDATVAVDIISQARDSAHKRLGVQPVRMVERENDGLRRKAR